MTLLADVASVLRERRVAFALIGASALAYHGISRSTLDQDLLVTDPIVLSPPTWSPLEAVADIRVGDSDDPLAGVVRVSRGHETDVDVVVGRFGWQADIVQRATLCEIDDAQIAVAGAEDLVLLKLFAGGSQDRWDIEQLLTLGGQEIAKRVEANLHVLPKEARDLWARLNAG